MTDTRKFYCSRCKETFMANDLKWVRCSVSTYGYPDTYGICPICSSEDLEEDDNETD